MKTTQIQFVAATFLALFAACGKGNPVPPPDTTDAGSADAGAVCRADPGRDAGSASIGGEIQPAPASVGTDIPVTYFGPPPSEVTKELIGPYQLLKSGKLDADKGTITLPLYQGQMRGTGAKVWYILTDTDDAANAAALGLNFSGKLSYAATEGTHATRTASLEKDGTLTFEAGTVDFSPVRSVTPGDAPNYFPPKAASPGSVGDAAYSPLVRIVNSGGHIYNAPVIAFNLDAAAIDSCSGNPDYSKVHDKVVALCPTAQTVTLKLFPGFSFGRPVQYLSMESNDPVVAALEDVTLAPGLGDVLIGHDDGAFSPVERLFAFANGPVNPSVGTNPQRQGLSSAIKDGRSPLNVLGGIPTVATDYSPLWDVNLAEWTQAAITNGYRSRLTEEFQVLGFVAKGWLTGPGGKPFGSSGAIVNCPIAFRFL
jgi:hypothetical protein